MELYVGMDVSLEETSICVVDGSGEIVCEGTVISEPEAIAGFIKAKAGSAKRIGLETGPTTTWLWHELRALGLPVICIDARHAKAALSMQINKSDRNDAVGLARIMQCGWYTEVQVKSVSCHEIRAVLNSLGQKRSLPLPAFQIGFAGESGHSDCTSGAQRRCIMAIPAEVLPWVLRRAAYGPF